MSQTQTTPASAVPASVMPANERVAIELGDDGVAQVRLIRGDKMNALDPEMFARIIEAGQVLNTMKGLRAVVLSGRARLFAPGSTSHRWEPSRAAVRQA